MIQLLKEENSGDRNVSYHKKTRVNLENNGRRKVTIHQSPLLWMLGPRDFTRKTMESWASSFYFHNYNSVSSSTKGPNPHTFLHHCVSLTLSPFCFFWLWDLKDRGRKFSEIFINLGCFFFFFFNWITKTPLQLNTLILWFHFLIQEKKV